MTNHNTTPTTVTWVVLEVRVGSHNMWAWCNPSPYGPGFDNIYYTERDGITAADPGTDIPNMGAHVFTVTLEMPTAEQRKAAAVQRFEAELTAEGVEFAVGEGNDPDGMVRPETEET